MEQLATYRYKNVIDVKRPLTFVNNTNYFLPEKDRTHVRISSPASYQSRRIKIEGYETRLYWEYKYCEENGGQTFFFTLTYCDEKIPKYMGQNVFDYKDLVYLLNGAFKKYLLRKYGNSFKYFVGAELGDGKGVRGINNNPHYHILFFLRPCNDERYPYKKIDPKQFRHLLRHYWQGFDEDIFRKNYRDSKFGIVKEGKYGILVNSFRALTYCAKYVTKDVHLKYVVSCLYDKYRQIFNIYNVGVLQWFYYRTYNSRLLYLDRKVFELKDLALSMRIEEQLPNQYCFDDLPEDYQVNFLLDLIKDNGDFSNLCAFVEGIIEFFVHKELLEYRNRYCNKCRISQGVGDYALEFIQDHNNPTIQVPSKDGFKNRPLPLYYYRKLFTDVVKDDNGNNLRVLNEEGIRYNRNRISKRLEKLRNVTKAQYESLDSELYRLICNSNVNDTVTMSFSEFQTLISNCDVEEVIRRYAEFKLIYEHRFCEFCSFRGSTFVVFDPIVPLFDFSKFIQPSFYLCDSMRPGYARVCASSGVEGYISYSAHPYFRDYLRVFDVFDLLSDYLFVKTDDKLEEEANEKERIRRFHVGYQMNLNFSG